MDELRQFNPAEAEEEDASRVYRIEPTGALLTLENAKAHLYHFCATSSLHTSHYVDLRPEFDTVKIGNGTTYTAQVTLPSFVHPEIRQASSSQAWCSEATAIKDTAFEAYVTLYKAGLVNDNLLPLSKDYGPDEGQLHVDQPSIVEVSERLSIWKELYRQTGYENAEWRLGTLTLSLNAEPVMCLSFFLTTDIPELSPFTLYWNEDTTYVVSIQGSANMNLSETQPKLCDLRVFTRNVLCSVHGTRMAAELDDFPVLLFPNGSQGVSGRYTAADLLSEDIRPEECGLIRVNGQIGRAFFFSSIAPSSDAHTQPAVLLTGFPKRRDFLHAVPVREATNTSYTTKQSFPLNDCTVDKLPARYAILAAFIPSIIHRLDIALISRNLQTGILQPVGIRDASLIAESLSSPAAGESTDYNRLEFLGDAILGFCAVVHVMSQHLNWPEGYLSFQKDRIVNNNTLAKAALSAGLDKYIMTKPFTGSKWRPIYISELLDADEEGKREMSSKALADVVEALIGAAFVDGGLAKASACIQTLLPNEDWHSQQDSMHRLVAEVGPSKPSGIALLEQLIGHHFTKTTLLIEAMTHVSFPHNRTGLSYERLEFLGDAVLDLIVVPKVFAHPRRLKHWELHRICGALVNSDFLGHCCMNHGIEEENFDVVEEKQRRGRSALQVKKSARLLHLHDFLRAGGQLIQAKRKSIEAFQSHRAAVEQGLEHGAEYPWPELIAMGPQKFFSDIVESVLGALYLDTHGDLSVCEAFAERLGILKHMRRILDDNVETAFPKEQVGILADTQTVEYSGSRSEGEDGRKTFECAVKIGGVDVASVVACGSKEEAELRAARAAVRVLEKRPRSSGSIRKRKLDVVMMDDDMIDDDNSNETDDGGVGLID